MKENNSYVINKDDCPDSGAVINNDTCSGCEHYKGFEMYLGQPCVKCSFYNDIHQESE